MKLTKRTKNKLNRILAGVLIASTLLFTNATAVPTFIPSFPYVSIAVQFEVPQAHAALRDNMVAWWELNEESGTRVDAHSTNDLTDNNTVLFGTGIVGNAADFETTGAPLEFLSIADNVPLSITGDICIAFWTDIESLGEPYTIASKFTTTGDQRSYLFQINTDQKMVVQFDDDGTGGTDISQFVTDLAVGTT